MKTGHHPHSLRHEAFSLIELLVVIGIMALVTAFVVPSFIAMTRSALLGSAGQGLVGDLNLARQTAVTKNCKVEVRLFQLPSKTSASDIAYRAFQLMVVKSDNSLQALTAVTRLQEPVILSNAGNASTLLSPQNASSQSTTDSVNTAAKWPVPSNNTSYSYVSFDFLPTGETDLDPARNWYVTFIIENVHVVANGLPANYFTVQVDPTTGKVSIFRP